MHVFTTTSSAPVLWTYISSNNFAASLTFFPAFSKEYASNYNIFNTLRKMHMIKIIIKKVHISLIHCIFDKFMHYSAVRVICTCIEKLFGNKDLAVIIHAFAAYGSLLVGFMQALARDMSQTSSLIAFSFMVAAMLFSQWDVEPHFY